MRRLKILSMENNKDVLKTETEAIIYAIVSNPKGLAQANRVEEHIQLESKFDNGTRCRVRKTSIKDNIKYHFTYKLNSQDEKTGLEINDEHTVEVDEDFFNGFKQISNRHIEKTRFIFSSSNVELKLKDDNGNIQNITIPNIEYEVDLFKLPDSDVEYSKWCKIDIEVDNIINFLSANHPELNEFNLFIKISHLPFEPTDSILQYMATDKEQKIIDDLWKEEFVKNINS